MLSRLRRRVVGAAMAAFTAAILVLLCAVDLWSWSIVVSQLDATLEQIVRFEVDRRPLARPEDPQDRPEGLQLPGPFDGASPEMSYMTRFFTVRFDQDGSAWVDQEFIASVSEQEAAEYGRTAVDRGRPSGFWEGYRYVMHETPEGTVVVFLNAERELRFMSALLLVSGGVAAASLLAVFLLVLLFSRRAIAPYVRSLETQKRFITDAGHELKTPLTAIATSADVLAMEHEGDEWVENIRSQTARMSRLVADLVTLSRLDEAQPFPDMADFSLSDAVWEISEPFSVLAGAKGKRYEQHIQDGVVLHGDRAAVQQMVSILLDNAVKYSDEGGTIRLELRRRAKRAEIVVFNTCLLADRTDLDRLFDRFYRPDSSRSKQTGGTGIGLSIAKATAEHHGGGITASSADGASLTFTVTL